MRASANVAGMPDDKRWLETQGPFLDETMDALGESAEGAAVKVPCLTVLLHPRLKRVGDVAYLDALAYGDTIDITRLAPDFTPVGGGRSRPLDDPFVSRKPVHIAAHDDHLVIVASHTRTRVVVDGEPVAGEKRIDLAQLTPGVIIELAGRIALLLHARALPSSSSLPQYGLVGASEGIEHVRAEIRRVIDVPYPVLLRGRTGTGKELVAAAIHSASPRANKPLVCVNMASVPGNLAASELFGHERGAFTGAVQRHQGHFERADEGTLFLDEVGDTPADVQTMLLRVLETSEILPLGGRRAVKVDVRLVAATDAPLEELIEAGAFRAPLLHRLSVYTIRIPGLSERRDDIGLLFSHFLQQELVAIGAQDRLSRPPEETPWIPASLMRKLVMHEWPGNVRELRNVVRQVVIRCRDKKQLQIQGELLVPAKRREAATLPELEAPPLGRATSGRAAPGGSSRGKTPGDITDDELVAALRQARFRIGATAKALGIPKSSLYYLIQKCPRVRKAKDLSTDELQTAWDETGGDLGEMTGRLEVSSRGIQLRMRELGMLPDS